MTKPTPISGKYRITYMDEWDQDYVDAEIPAFILFNPDGRGEFHFGYVSGSMDYEQTERDGRPAVEWTFEGNDEMDPISGRGWAVLQEVGTIKGKFFVHQGDSSTFAAEKDQKKPTRRKPQSKLPATDAKTVKTVTVSINKIKPGRIRQPSLPDDLLKRIRAIHTAVSFATPAERRSDMMMRIIR